MNYSVSQFVKERRDFFLKIQTEDPSLISKKCILVFGNEACDLDSTISAIAMSYLYDRHSDGRLYVPLVSATRRELLLMRGEVLHVLRLLSITLDDLLYLSEIDLKGETISAFLTDHNELALYWTRQMRPPSPIDVIAIIDHHQDAGKFLRASPRDIRVCGSTCSILALRALMYDNDDIQKDLLNDHSLGFTVNERSDDTNKISTFRTVPADLREALLSVIVFDTVNMSWRETDTDWAAISALTEISDRSLIKKDTSLIMACLEEAVFSVPEASIELADILYKDCKIYEDSKNRLYAITVVRVPLTHYMQSGNHEEIVQQFMRDQSLYLLLVLIPIRERGSESFNQHLAIFVDEKIITVESIYEILQRENLRLDSLEYSGTGGFWNAYVQGNTQISRKQIHPILKNFLGSPLES